MKSLLVTLALAFSAPLAQADVRLAIERSDYRIELHSDQDVCQGEALLAKYVKKGIDLTKGCWKVGIVNGVAMVGISWFDADSDLIPVTEFDIPVNLRQLKPA